MNLVVLYYQPVDYRDSKKNETVIFHERCYPFIAKDLPYMYEYPVYKKYMSDEALAREEELNARNTTYTKSRAKTGKKKKRPDNFWLFWGKAKSTTFTN